VLEPVTARSSHYESRCAWLWLPKGVCCAWSCAGGAIDADQPEMLLARFEVGNRCPRRRTRIFSLDAVWFVGRSSRMPL